MLTPGQGTDVLKAIHCISTWEQNFMKFADTTGAKLATKAAPLLMGRTITTTISAHEGDVAVQKAKADIKKR